MSVLEKLKTDSFRYVKNLDSPIGVYLRKEMFGKETVADAKLRKEMFEKITLEQREDGSWDQLFVKTANSLWNLFLLGFKADESNVAEGLQWLLSIQKEEYKGYPGFFNLQNKKDPSIMRSTYYGEFGPGCTIFYETTYAIHLLHLFGFDRSKQVETTINSYLKFWKPTWCGAWCNINVLNILIEHPISKESKTVENAINHFASLQTKTGTWKGYPFYHTLHALSKSNSDCAKKQQDKACPSIIRRQNEDGSWGRKEPQTETFLALDFIRNFSTA
jgi:hypothetical protein